jgi:hypothetical protein
MRKTFMAKRECWFIYIRDTKQFIALIELSNNGFNANEIPNGDDNIKCTKIKARRFLGVH